MPWNSPPIECIDDDAVEHAVRLNQPCQTVSSAASYRPIQCKVSPRHLKRSRVDIYCGDVAAVSGEHGGERSPATSNHQDRSYRHLADQSEHSVYVRGIAYASHIGLTLAPSLLTENMSTARPVNADEDRPIFRFNQVKKQHHLPVDWNAQHRCAAQARCQS